MYWTNSIFKIGGDTLFTILVTIAIFFLGIIFQGLWHAITAYLNRRKVRRMFAFVLKEFIVDTEKQSQNLRKNADQFTFENRNEYNILNTNITSSKMFKDIGFKYIYEAFFVGLEYYLSFGNRSEYHEKYMLLIKNIIDVEYWHEKLMIDTFKAIDSFNKHHDFRNNALESFRQKVDNVAHDLIHSKVTKEFKEYIEGVDDIYCKWQAEAGGTAPHIANDVLVQPLLEHNRKHPEIRLAIQLNDDLLLACAHFKNQKNVLAGMKNQTSRYADIFDKFAKSAKELEELNKCSWIKPRTW